MTGAVRNVLTIAGSDPSGGAGIQADLRTFAALGVHGCAVIAALTAQNTVAVSAVMSVPVEFLRHQLDSVFSDVRVDAIKIGMLGSADVIRAVAAALRAHHPPFVVLDPVMRASTGARLLDADAVATLRHELFPLVTLITPNAAEVGALLGIAAPTTVPDARTAATRLGDEVNAVLVTGGHLVAGEMSVDVLCERRSLSEFVVPRVHVTSTHGSGCTASSAIAALLATGIALPEACAGAQRFTAAAIRHSGDLTVGHGAGPVHQLGELWARAAQ